MSAGRWIVATIVAVVVLGLAMAATRRLSERAQVLDVTPEPSATERAYVSPRTGKVPIAVATLTSIPQETLWAMIVADQATIDAWTPMPTAVSGDAIGNGRQMTMSGIHEQVTQASSFPPLVSRWAESSAVVRGTIHDHGEPTWTNSATSPETLGSPMAPAFVTMTIAVSDVLGSFQPTSYISDLSELDYLVVAYDWHSHVSTPTAFEEAMDVGDVVITVFEEWLPEMYQDPPAEEWALEARALRSYAAMWSRAEALRSAGFEAAPVASRAIFLMDGERALLRERSIQPTIWSSSEVMESLRNLEAFAGSR